MGVLIQRPVAPAPAGNRPFFGTTHFEAWLFGLKVSQQDYASDPFPGFYIKAHNDGAPPTPRKSDVEGDCF